ncbi:MAG: AMP-binding protein, partial [Bacteriovoracales bacterium]
IISLWLVGATPFLISKKDPESEISRKIIQVGTFLESSKVPRIIFFTSGSQGNPKPILHTLENLIKSAQASVDFYGINSTDRYLVTLPLNHVGGLMIIIRSILAKCLCIFPENEIPFKNYNPTMLSLVPTQLLKLKDEEFLKNAKAILVGGNAFLKSLTPKIKELPISLTYGMTESAAQVAASKTFTEEMEILPGREIKISKEGNILIKGGMGKYLNQSEELNNEGFFQTSDKGIIVEGHLKVFGRDDKIFIRGGENISPQEIEDFILEIPDISFAKVIPVKDENYGQIPVLFYGASRDITAEEFNQYLKVNLAPFKIPQNFIKVPENSELKWNERDLMSLYETKLH